MIRVELKVLQANLEYYYRKLDEGESIEVLDGGKVLYVLTEPFKFSTVELPKRKPTLTKRPLGLHQGEYVIPENFNDPLSDEMMDLFYNAPFVSPKDTVK